MTTVFNKLLIANRGEIACRIIRTARLMGLETVAVFSDADADALHVEMADQAVRIGPAPAHDSYLKGDRILEAARRSGAGAIHPGYGFLSENAEFAEACAKAGIVFVGPPGEAIRKMGLKDEAKRLMETAGVPIVPGYLGEDQSPERLAKEADAIGYPVLIKATAGGGGKGMRRVDAAPDFSAALTACKREAAGGFGNDNVLIEKFIEKPRHIELQVFADSQGDAVHLFERDCSLQRRHQKVVEEAPAPGMPEEMRAKMGAAAAAAAKAIGYVGAGTIEFIVDVANGLDDAPFFFMEMNTRLQVEHPVTEWITGEDLVEWQLQVAAGEPLPRRQDDIELDGHAVEVRLYAEDADRDFLPATGTLTRFRTPQDDDLIRVDSGVRAGDTVSVHYDPMIAKIIAWGEDRPTALDRLARALERTEVTGLTTNLAFLYRAVTHPDFVAGAIDTGFIPRHIDDLLPAPTPAPDEVLILATLGILEARADRAVELALDSADTVSPWHVPSGWRLNLPAEEVQRFTDATGMERSLRLIRSGDGYDMDIDGTQHHHVILHGTDIEDRLRAEIDGLTVMATVLAGQQSVTVLRDARAHVLDRLSAKFDPEDEAEGPGAVTAPMPGKVLEVMVADGDNVEKGQPLLVLEAMKMEQTLNAPRAGIVSGLAVRAGAQVSDGAVLLTVTEDA